MRSFISTTALALPPARTGGEREDAIVQRRGAMDRFLYGVQRRALRMARLAVRDNEDALDIVQDAMLRLVRHYAAAPESEWPALFFRILGNRINDHHRRGTVRRRVTGFLRWPGAAPDIDNEEDPFASVPGPEGDQPERRAALDGALGALEDAVAALPARQQQAFLLRTVEGFDVSRTATVMGCSEGSVKTHYSRAVHSLRARLGEHWP